MALPQRVERAKHALITAVGDDLDPSHPNGIGP